jgi:FtsP/CotA-like multicopper oxidase with cupredoxin domain
MDMNTVMYPESGDAAMKMDMKSNGVKMKMDMKEPKMDHSTHAMVSPDIETLNYSMLKSTVLPLPQDAPVRELRFELTGNMNRYVWSMDNKVLSKKNFN